METFVPKNEFEFFRDLKKLESIYKSNQYYIAGFISYEAGYFLEEKLSKLRASFYPEGIFHLSVFENPRRTIFQSTQSYQTKAVSVQNVRYGISEKEYKQKIERIQDFLTKGESYQINFTFPVRFETNTSALEFYNNLKLKQSVAYGAFMDLGESQILSLSPELFLKFENGRVLAKPMKGTAKRSPLPEIDEWISHSLFSSEKNRAENLMITDLIRNDIGRYSEIGSVKVSSLFEIETFESIHQMTSSVESKLASDFTFWDLFWGMFPCGSVTGAPKIRSMEIIQALEHEQRGIYTGSIGYFAPKNSKERSLWNIAIRTIEFRNGSCKLGIGSGITIESQAEEEWRECQSKLRFIGIQQNLDSSSDEQKTDNSTMYEQDWITDDFKLFESIGWTGNRFKLLNYHRSRIQKSAKYFGIPFNASLWTKHLNDFVKSKESISGRIKYNLYKDGSYKIIFFPMDFKKKQKDKSLQINKIQISEKIIHSDSLYLYHKTSFRKIYDESYKTKKEFYDILFINERKELTESCVHNLFLKMDGIYFTPSIDSGILRGTLREYCLKKFPRWFQEKILVPEDLLKADKIILGNSVRGFTECIY